MPSNVSDAIPVTDDLDVQEQILRVGEALWKRTRGEAPGLFNPRFWHGMLLEWSMRDPAFKTDLFRFIDVLPALQTAEQVADHIRMYLLRAGREAPLMISLALKAATGRWTTGLGAWAIRRNVTDMARRFIVGENVEQALPALKALRGEGIAFTADLLGEATLGQGEAAACQARYLELIERLATEAARWPADPLLDRNHLGPIPRANISIKISALDPALDPVDAPACVARLLGRVLPLFLKARERGVFINIDLEQWALHDIIFDLFEAVALRPELRDWPHLGIVVQAYLRSAGGDVERLRDLARRRGAPLTVRLVKGAYWDAEVVRTRQFGYPCPVWLDKARTDAAYEALTGMLFENAGDLWPAFGSHNLRSLSHVLVRGIRLAVPENAYEIQMIYGMAEPERRALRQMGRRVRVYTPIGELLPGMAYLVRRLLENTANSGFLRMSYHERVNLKTLLAPPQPRPEAAPGGNGRTAHSASEPGEPPFENCALTDFTDPARRAEFAAAVARAGASLPLAVPVAIAGRPREMRELLRRPCPGDTSRIVASVALATPKDAADAAQVALAAWPAWRDRPLEERARLLEVLAGRLEAARPDLAALETWETAKPWREADADVAEAIDFCRYYAFQARRELAPRALGSAPGEQNLFYFEGRGPAAVIAPWNFPLAILCGMTVAALVAGNTVVLKPAEQSSAVAHAFYLKLLEAGFPPDTISFLPGIGEEVGRALVEHPLIATVAFTGSRAVGLKIIEAISKTAPGQPQVKRVVCEMGGKNAIVVDEDADLDEAVAGVVKSAFDYAGQKCSACSRVIVTQPVAELFTQRLIAATAALPAAPPWDPACRLGPVIDEEAWRRLIGVIEHPGDGAALVYRGAIPEGGWFVPPAIFTVTDPNHRLMREELFGPLLAVYRAPGFAEALRIAGASEYALTGGVYSRNPDHLALARHAFRVGNLYLNRPITGAIVGRQPFGGFAMSGVGAKSGGPGYLEQFAQPRCITENTTRHGFTPEVVT